MSACTAIPVLVVHGPAPWCADWRWAGSWHRRADVACCRCEDQCASDTHSQWSMQFRGQGTAQRSTERLLACADTRPASSQLRLNSLLLIGKQADQHAPNQHRASPQRASPCARRPAMSCLSFMQAFRPYPAPQRPRLQPPRSSAVPPALSSCSRLAAHTHTPHPHWGRAGGGVPAGEEGCEGVR